MNCMNKFDCNLLLKMLSIGEKKKSFLGNAYGTLKMFLIRV